MGNWDVDLAYIEDWLINVDQQSYEQVVAAIELLAERGPQLGRPLVDTIKASRHKNMKELRPGSAGRSCVCYLRSTPNAKRSSSLREIKPVDGTSGIE